MIFSSMKMSNKVVQYEPNEAYSPEILGTLASIGIEKGKPFAPDERMKKILTEAAAVGNATARAIVFRISQEGSYFYPNSAWFTAFIGGNYQFLSQPGVRDLDARVHFIYYATGVTPAMALKMVGVGSQYAAAVYGLRRQAARWQQDLQDSPSRPTSPRKTSGHSSSMTTKPARCCRPTSSSPA